MHFIVGVLLAVMDTEEAFWCFCSIIESQLQADWQAHVGDHHPQQDKKCLLRIHSFRLWYILYICCSLHLPVVLLGPRQVADME